jgi:hypothetical protein
VEDGNVGERLDPASEDGIGVPHRDLIGGVGDGLGGRGARAVESVGGNAREELGEEAHLAPDVRRECRGDDLAEDHLVHLAAIELAAHQQLAGGVPRERDGRDVAEDGPALGERGTQAGDDGNPSAGPEIVHEAPAAE